MCYKKTYNLKQLSVYILSFKTFDVSCTWDSSEYTPQDASGEAQEASGTPWVASGAPQEASGAPWVASGAPQEASGAPQEPTVSSETLVKT